jgi:subtilase family serine protease
VRSLNLKSSGRLSASTRLNLVIGLPWRNREALTNLLEELYDPASPQFHHFLTPQQFAEQFGPATNDYETLAAFTEAHGLTVTHRHPNRMLLDVSGPATAVEQLLHVHLLTYHHPTEARDFFAPDVQPSLDAPVQVLDINGLDNFSRPSSYLHIETNTYAGGAQPYAGSGIAGLYDGYDFRDAYMPGVTLTGLGQSIGLFEMDGYYPSDIISYEAHAQIPFVPLTNVLLDGITNNNAGTNNLEVALDIEVALAMAPGVNKIIVYEGTNSADILNRMATDDLANQLSSSWKPFDASALTDQALQELAAQGQSMFQASGDSGAQPALDISQPSSPYETLVGGTDLTTSGGQGSWVSETVWNSGTGSASGGGISLDYGIPSWQAAVSMANNQGSTVNRNSPDVALVAKNVEVMANNGLTYGVGGTSCSAPLMAGILALVNQQAAQWKFPPVGFINPALYRLGQSSGYLSCFHDIAIGNSFTTASPTEFSAVAGYDLCTGWGAPNGRNFINALLPGFAIAMTGNQVQVSWPAAWANILLQQNSNLVTAPWITVTNPVNTISNFSSVTIAPAGTADFFRLTTP